MKILVVDDDPTSRHLIHASLIKWGYKAISAESCEEAYDIVCNEGINFIICDWVMPGKMQGIDLVNRLRTRPSLEYTYIIMLTMKSEKKDIIQGMQAGVDDYVKKPFISSEMRLRVQLGTRILTLKQECIQLKQKISSMSGNGIRDSVTGVFDRPTTFEKINSMLAQCSNNKIPLSIILTYIDNIKSLKYSYGHKFADEATVEFIKRLSGLCPGNGFIGHFSDEEFLMVLPNSNQRDCQYLADQMWRKVNGKPVTLANRLPFELSLSIGSATSEPDNIKVRDDLILQALYQIRSYQ